MHQSFYVLKSYVRDITNYSSKKILYPITNIGIITANKKIIVTLYILFSLLGLGALYFHWISMNKKAQTKILTEYMNKSIDPSLRFVMDSLHISFHLQGGISNEKKKGFHTETEHYKAYIEYTDQHLSAVHPKSWTAFARLHNIHIIPIFNDRDGFFFFFVTSHEKKMLISCSRDALVLKKVKHQFPKTSSSFLPDFHEIIK